MSSVPTVKITAAGDVGNLAQHRNPYKLINHPRRNTNPLKTTVPGTCDETTKTLVRVVLHVSIGIKTS